MIVQQEHLSEEEARSEDSIPTPESSADNNWEFGRDSMVHEDRVFGSHTYFDRSHGILKASRSKVISEIDSELQRCVDDGRSRLIGSDASSATKA